MSKLLKVFEPVTINSNFDEIKISIASPDVIRSWSFGEVKNQKQLIIELLSLKKTAFFVLRFLALLKIMNAFVENIKE